MADHALTEAVEFTTQVIGWRDLPEGGSVPIRGPIRPPYWRWYCRCGAIGGKHGTEQLAVTDHARHAQDASR